MSQFKFDIGQIVMVNGVKCYIDTREIFEDAPDYLCIPVAEINISSGIELPGWVRTDDIEAVPAPKHTPGPWSVNDMALNYVIHSEDYVQARTDSHSETDLANARLIAAAPDMYAALKDGDAHLNLAIGVIEDVISAGVYDVDDSLFLKKIKNEIVAAARMTCAAIAKARGES